MFFTTFNKQVRRRQGVRQPKVVSGIGLWNAPGNALWNAPGNALWNAPGRVFSGWSIYTSPQKLIPSPIDSARRVKSIPHVSTPTMQGPLVIQYPKSEIPFFSRFFPFFSCFFPFFLVFFPFSKLPII